MDDILQFCVNVARNWDQGELVNYPDPVAPSSLGTALTQAEIDTLKKFIKEIQERFSAP